ncbi:YidH family protein [Corynebacterium pyruviciproducens]|uniref:YidH family protein n=1 Tax=Corynebacterium pyruviciproducens TaxID=598660 RepID=UPI00058C85F7|nr:DUF202 domain-containing protein [Corynebacterium pyruviciproducens]
MTTSSDRSALARAVFPEGEEPDPRFTLANERTFLAWTRTALAFLAGGIAIEAFPIAGLGPAVRMWLAIFVTAVGMVIAGGAAFRWVRVERAMRTGRPLPMPAVIPLLSVAAFIACAVIIWLFLR